MHTFYGSCSIFSLVVLLQVSVQVLSTVERSPQLGCSGRFLDCLQCLHWDIQLRGPICARVALQGGAELREGGAGVMVKVPGVQKGEQVYFHWHDHIDNHMDWTAVLTKGEGGSKILCTHISKHQDGGMMSTCALKVAFSRFSLHSIHREKIRARVMCQEK